ncbi:RNA-guided endonuclease InsQ/TnpB family protein [Dactylococcopsis salina]|uniref:Transposase n=1 Tax=Dactylococcopsis salina (strain PCC 8305) TaxID=13035 RepID=K9YTV6_DACS8|nr:RNA-guided endonuclease TnpB family protein [Dactylococcopsis salina]AFZ49937.1 transposase [Dactylococcopsis salina PCC 8305]
MLSLNYQYKLKVNKQQASTIDEWLDVCKSVYNYALRERKDWVNSRKCPIDRCSLESEYIIPSDAPRPTYANQCKGLGVAKKKFPRLSIPQSQVLQQTLKGLEEAFVNMWNRGFGFPRFKKKMRSFVFPQVKPDCIQGETITLPKLGKLPLVLSRPIPEGFIPKQVRIIKKASGYYININLQLDVDVPDVPPHGYPIGIDLGLEKFLATSEGELIKGHKFLRESEGKLKSLQGQLKNKKKGSRRWRNISRRIARLYEKITNCRKDFFYKTSHYLCDQAGMIFVEDLNLKALGRSALRKACLDAAWGTFVNILSYVCWKRGVFFAKVNANGTSQICPECGVNCGKKTLSERVHKCPDCGYEQDRDVAAAMVVKKRGESTVGATGRMLDQGKEFGDEVLTSSRLSL